MKVSSGPNTVPVLFWTLAAPLALYRSGVYATENTKNCKLFSESASERNVLSRLEPLTNKNFTVETKDGEDSYKYVFQLCGDAGGVQGAGVIQVKGSHKPTIIGMYNATQAIGGSDWVILIYRNGQMYNKPCAQEMRRAIVMISCSRNVDIGQLEMIVEEKNRSAECFYLFELDASAVCPALPSQISTGSIILIIGFCLMAVYLVGGFLYQRLVVGAKGMEQFPNHAFWVEFGNLTADGCDFVCRTRPREEAPTYRGVATEPTEEEEQEERDDHLLPM